MASSDYVLGRGYISATRLNIQHYMWREILGYSLHPNIPLPSNPKIADVATGTGIWLCDLAARQPQTAQLDGFDLSSSQFPPASCLPSNVHLQVLDATKSPPKHLCGVYDLVHIRLLVLVIENDDPSSVLEHCLALLKPGGYLQWDETDTAALYATQVDRSSTVCLEKLLGYLATGKPYGWIARLPDIFKQHHLEMTVVESKRVQDWHRNLIMENWCILAEEYASAALDCNGPTVTGKSKGDEVRMLARGVYEEAKQGSYLSHLLRITVGKKKANNLGKLE